MDTIERLKALMETRGISKYRISKMAGTSPSTITNWLNGTTTPNKAMLEVVLSKLTSTEYEFKDGPEVALAAECGENYTTSCTNSSLCNSCTSSSLIIETRPRIPTRVTAGTLSSFAEAVKSEDCEQIPVVKAFPVYDFTIIVKGDSMEPKFEGGDEIAIRKISDFIEWGKPHVLDTRDGAVLKRIYDEGDSFRCVSYNKEYPDFHVGKEDVFGVYKVVGLLRM